MVIYAMGSPYLPDDLFTISIQRYYEGIRESDDVPTVLFRHI